MKTYQRILQYAPIQRFIVPFFSYAILASIFNILTFTLIQTLLDVLFTASPKGPILASNADVMEVWVYKFNKFIYDFTQNRGKINTLWLVCFIIISAVLLSNIFRYLSSRVIEMVKGFTVRSLRKTVFDKALGLDLSYFGEKRKGDIISRLTTDIQEVENSIGKAFSAIFKDVVLLIIYFVVLFWRSWQLTLFSLLIIPLSGIVIGSLTKKLREKASDVQENQANLLSLFDEAFGAIRLIKGYSAEKYIKEKFDFQNNNYYRSWLKMMFRQEAAAPISEILGVVLVASILLYGGTMVLSPNSTMSASAFVAYVALYSQVTRPAKEISNALAGTQRGVVAAERILSLVDSLPEITDSKTAQEIISFEKEIEFRNVRFSYDGSKQVLDNISFTLKKGKTLALVGSSGSGKTTLADLLPRFYDVNEGEILIDGVNIKQIKLDSLRQLMGIVNQESVMFNDTIKNNILFGRNASDEELIHAAGIANARQFIEQKPEAYDHVIGDRGAKLSGGQRQRLSIARAILKNPPILIMDEATSALDAESEKLVQDALSSLMKNRTSLIIAHRLSTIQHADEILVLKKGKIVEQGNHQALMQLPNGIYKKMNTLHEI